MKRIAIFVLLTIASYCYADNHTILDNTIVDSKGDTIKILKLLDGNHRTLVHFFNTWTSTCIKEMDIFYKKGIIDLCKSKDVELVLITDKRSYPFADLPDSLNWIQRLEKDFSVYIGIDGNFAYPSTAIIEADITISYHHGYHRSKESELIYDWINYSLFQECKVCEGTGINPNKCLSCKGTGRCKICESIIDWWKFNCSSCGNSRICRHCKGDEYKGETCVECYGVGKVLIKSE